MNIDETVDCMIDYLKMLPEGTKLCSGALIGKFHSKKDHGSKNWFEIHRKFCDEAWKNGGGNVTWQRTFLLKIFYAQMIKKFVGEIPDLIESCRTAKKVS